MNKTTFVYLINNADILNKIRENGYLFKFEKGQDFTKIEQKIPALSIKDLDKEVSELIDLLKNKAFKEYCYKNRLGSYAIKKATERDILNLYIKYDYTYEVDIDLNLNVNILVNCYNDLINTSLIDTSLIKKHLLKFNFNINNVLIDVKDSDDKSDVIWYKCQYVKTKDLKNKYNSVLNNYLNLYLEYRNYFYCDLVFADEDVKNERYKALLKKDNIIENYIMNKVINMPVMEQIDVLENGIRQLRLEVAAQKKRAHHIPF